MESFGISRLFAISSQDDYTFGIIVSFRASIFSLKQHSLAFDRLF